MLKLSKLLILSYRRVIYLKRNLRTCIIKFQQEKVRFPAKNYIFFQFFSIFATYLKTPKIFNAQFSESSEKKIPKKILLQPFKYQKKQRHEFWSAQPQPCGNGRRIYVVFGTKCPTPSGIGLRHNIISQYLQKILTFPKS